jgi:hypothetical protein
VDDRAVPCLPQNIGQYAYHLAVSLAKRLVEDAK